jgi:surface antigen Omp85-like protein
MRTFYIRSVLISILVATSCWICAQTDSTAKNPGQSLSQPMVRVAADSTMRGKGIKKMLAGKNYRKEWTEPVTMPVFDFNSNGGMRIEKPGGGKETKSLHLESSDGKKWSLRSVEKFPENAIPVQLRKTEAEKLFKSGVSASYPYGALSMEIFSNAAHVPYMKQKLVYLHNTDDSLGKYKPGKNLVMFLEEGTPSGITKKSEEGNVNGSEKKTLNTQELIYELQQKGNIKIDQLSVLRARLLDNFVMDFDRHEEQWDWIATGNSNTFYVVPKDRDQVFYKGDGILMKILASKNFFPQLQGFRAKTKNVTTFNGTAQNFDRHFLNELTEADWNNEIDQFVRAMTDSVIEEALRRQPPETQKYAAGQIAQALKEKRKYFKDEMMRYYRFLSSTVSIVGSNKKDQFTILQNANGSVTVQKSESDSSEKTSRIAYERTFDPRVTREIRIYGLEGDDKFTFTGEKSPIKVRVIGGPGNDEFINHANASNVHVYDVSFEQNIFSGNDDFKKTITDDPENNTYTRLGYRYNSFSPGVAIETSVDGGLFLGLKLKIVKQDFRQDPYASKQVFFVTRRIGPAAYHIKYSGDFLKVFGNTDLLPRADIQLPTTRTLFFGLGNNTEFDKSQPGGYKNYRVHYNIANISLSAQNSINSWLRVRYGPVFQYFRAEPSENQNNLAYATYYASNKSVDSARFYGGLGASVLIDTKNDELIPTRGVDADVYARALAGLTATSRPVSEIGGHMSLHTDFISKNHLILSSTFGASKIFGNYEFEQAQYLGFKQNLRGFRFDRFAGRSRAYNNTELRWRFGDDVNLGLFRGSLGLLAFNDIGRVWIENEQSKRWHDGYGWGLWIAPLNRLVLAATLSYSNEEKNMAFVTIGFQF